MDLLKRFAFALASASAITAFIFLFCFSLAGIASNELNSEDVCMVLFVWGGTFLLSLYATNTTAE